MNFDFDSFSCPVCFEKYEEKNRPQICCSNGHTLCNDCFQKVEKCPLCRGEKLPTPIVNLILYQAIEELEKRLVEVDDIPFQKLQIEDEPFDSGAFGDIYRGRWMNFPIVVKKVRNKHLTEGEKRDIKKNVSLIIPMSHPNITRYYGTTHFPDGRIGIVIEYVEGKNLGTLIKDNSLRYIQKIQIAIGVASALQKLHASRIAHRDLKPENILILEKGMIAKVADFGVAKLVQTLTRASQSIVGTAQYTAPEILKQSVSYGTSVDVYSYSITLYELFTGLQAFKNEPLMRLMYQVSMEGKRPSIPENLDPGIAKLIERGWDGDPDKRPKLEEFEKFFSELQETHPETPHKQPSTSGGDLLNDMITNQKRVLIGQISEEVKLVEPPVPRANLWKKDLETSNSVELRNIMMDELRNTSSFRKIFNENVLNVMSQAPRHLFLSNETYPKEEERVKISYSYNKAARATRTSVTSSPEIIGSMLSLIKVSPSNSVCVFGIKGGYIQSLLSNLVGYNGKVVVYSTDERSYSVVKERVQRVHPQSFMIKWILGKDLVGDLGKVEGEGPFDCVFFCGAVKEMNMMFCRSLLRVEGGMLIAPVGEKGKQRLTIFTHDSKDKFSKRVITDWGVIFGELM